MANPFNVFRKNQKAALAVLGVLAMVSFVVLPIVSKIIGAAAGGGDRVVAKCAAYGDLNAMQLQTLQSQRRQLAGFLRYAMRLLTQDQDRPPMALQRMYQQINNFEGEAVAREWMLARYAQEKGIRVSDESIVLLLNELFDNRLTTQQLTQMLGELGIHEDTLFAELRDYLLKRQLMMMMGLSLDSATPGQRWEWFQRLNREVSIEAAAVPVESLVDQIETPEESVLREFFAEHKNEVQVPSSPETGFAIPKKVAVEYFVVSMDNLDTESIPQEEVEQYYEENKNQLFRRESFSSFEGINEGTSDLTEGGPQLPGMEDGGAFPLDISDPATPSESESDEGAAPESENATTPPEIGTSQPEASEADSENEEESEPAEEEAAETSPETSSTSIPHWFRTVSYQEESEATDEKAEDDESASESEPQNQPAETEAADPAGGEGEKEAGSAEETPADAAPEGEQDAEHADSEEASSEEASATEANDTPPEIGKQTDDQPPVEDTSNLYKPLSEVEDQIRRTLARQERMQKAELLEGRMNRFFQDYFKHMADPRNPKPASLDFSALAEEHDITSKETGLLDVYEFSKLPVADAQIGQTGAGSTVVDVLFNADLNNYEVFRAMDTSGDLYLLWVLHSTERRVPEFSEVREEVLNRWKEVQARKLALEKARRLAKEARETGTSLRSVFSENDDVPVVESDFFSWLDYGDLQPWQLQMYRYQIPLQVSQIQEKNTSDEEGDSTGKKNLIVAPGNEFMKKVFSLQVNEVGVAMNQPETSAYVVRVLASRPDGTELWESFQQTPFQTYQGAGRFDTSDVMQAWNREVEKETGFEWIGWREDEESD